MRTATLLPVLAALAVVGCAACAGSNSTPVVAAPPATSGTVAAISLQRCDGNGEVTAVATAVGPDRLVTVAHAFVDASSLTVVDAGGADRAADLVHLDRQRDIALVEVDRRTDGRDDDWFSLGTVDEGEAVTVVLPGGGGATSTVPATVDRVVDISIDGVGLRAGLELDVALDPGRSGAPVIDGDGFLVGMAFAADKNAATGWAVAATEIGAALEKSTGGPIELSC